jgi:hypothetical protein
VRSSHDVAADAAVESCRSRTNPAMPSPSRPSRRERAARREQGQRRAVQDRRFAYAVPVRVRRRGGPAGRIGRWIAGDRKVDNAKVSCEAAANRKRSRTVGRPHHRRVSGTSVVHLRCRLRVGRAGRSRRGACTASTASSFASDERVGDRLNFFERYVLKPHEVVQLLTERCELDAVDADGLADRAKSGNVLD